MRRLTAFRRHLGLRRLRRLYTRHLAEPRRERMFLSSVFFFLTFAITRAITVWIRSGASPIHNLRAGSTHIHHLVFGICLLLVVGYLAMVGVDVEHDHFRTHSRLLAIAFAVGAALTLDEFALWLRLQDVYWSPQGELSVQACVLFGSGLSAFFWGRPLLRAVGREVRMLAIELSAPPRRLLSRRTMPAVRPEAEQEVPEAA